MKYRYELVERRNVHFDSEEEHEWALLVSIENGDYWLLSVFDSKPDDNTIKLVLSTFERGVDIYIAHIPKPEGISLNKDNSTGNSYD